MLLSSSAVSKSKLSTAELLQPTPWQPPHMLISWIPCFLQEQALEHWFWLSDRQLQQIMDIDLSWVGDWKKIWRNYYHSWFWQLQWIIDIDWFVRSRGLKLVMTKYIYPLEIFHRTPWVENFCSVKPSLQVNTDKPSQGRFWKQKLQETFKTMGQTQASQKVFSSRVTSLD